jgi:cation:H+ antiporter
VPDLTSIGVGGNVAVFSASAALVWCAGTALTRLADLVGRRFGWGQATVGILILAVATSLPEIATSFTAALSGDAQLAVNNLLGSIALQIALLALADVVYDKRALTSVVPDPVVMLQGALNVVLLAIVAIAIVYGDHLILGAGTWSWGLLAAAIYSMNLLSRSGERRPWIAKGLPLFDESATPATGEREPHLILKTVLTAALILLAGFAVTRSGAALADLTGIGPSFMGVAFLALATSLPEASTVFAAMRRGRYTMAISDILGTNILNVGLLWGIDILSPGAPVLSVVGRFAALGALIGVVVTALFVMGLAERKDRTVWRMGTDSLAVLVVYVGGMIMLFSLR